MIQIIFKFCSVIRVFHSEKWQIIRLHGLVYLAQIQCLHLSNQGFGATRPLPDRICSCLQQQLVESAAYDCRMETHDVTRYYDGRIL